MADTKELTAKPKRKRNRPDLANFGQENIEPGDNKKFLAHALIVRDLPPIDSADPVQVEQRINDYFSLCVENDMKPTPAGFRISLGISKGTLSNWRNGVWRSGTHQDIICKAYDLLDALWQDYMYNGKINPVSGIFIGKNEFHYADKQEVVLTPNQQKLSEEDYKTIEAKYEELPGE
jgi:hypothetical protein